ncbi:MAG: hypothetical protein J4G18_08630 [Anaerolineae bacterium]|nr:hypothetical protein [Anaerolineae bacterium]
MSIKRFALVFALLALLTAAVSANDDTDSDRSKPAKRAGMGFSLMDETLLEATGLDAEALRTALAGGSTVAELIEANEGDADAVIADIAAQLAADINESTASFLEGLDERVSEEMDASRSRRAFWGRRWIQQPRIFMYTGVSDAILEATGLDAAGLRAALAEGATLAGLIEAKDGDLAEFTAEIVALIRDEVNAAAAERIEGLEESLSEFFNSDLSERWRRGRRGRKGPRFFFGYWGVYGEPAAEEPAA